MIQDDYFDPSRTSVTVKSGTQLSGTSLKLRKLLTNDTRLAVSETTETAALHLVQEIGGNRYLLATPRTKSD